MIKFIESKGDSKVVCPKCCYHYTRDCSKKKCISSDRKDGKSGYYVMFDTEIRNESDLK